MRFASANFIMTFVKVGMSKKSNQGPLDCQDYYRHLLQQFGNVEALKGMMKILLDRFEHDPADTAKVAEEVAVLLRGDGDSLLQTMIITNEVHDQQREKFLVVHFHDEHGTFLVFHVKKKMKMLTLRTIAAATISRCLQKSEDVLGLELPKNVIYDIQGAFKDSWKPKVYHHSKIRMQSCIASQYSVSKCSRYL